MHIQTIISATSRQEANTISDFLVKNKLIAGSMIIKGPCRYWWEDKIVEKEYYNIQAFTLTKNKDRIIQEVKNLHSDKCPIIVFIKIGGNKEFLDWIEESVEPKLL